MKRFFVLAFAAFIGMGLALDDAEARRLGGGKNLGKQRESVNQAAPKPPPQAAPQQPAAPAGGSRWLGPLAGLAAGGLLAALFFGGAFEGLRFADILILLALAAAIYFVIRAFRSKPVAQRASYAGPGAGRAPTFNADLPATARPATPPAYPPGFDAAGFLKSAKLSFNRLQAANDKRDLEEIRDYMTPELFAEIDKQLTDQSIPNKTEVVTLDAQLLEVVTEGDLAVASVRFSGLIREDSVEAQPFDEIWHVEKSLSDPKAVWLVAGIQQARPA
ncbi:MAG TPA: Tim44-like domain-containing protein [Burkholderiales bacterium]|nr:Tim44-like domain-containing protein [Burkholderiales bacterium]